MADKKDLLKTIEEQQQKLNLYEKRLRDVITAYKSLVKEKEALEASLKALTHTSVSTATSDQNNSSDPSNQQESNETDRNSDVRLREKVSTLTLALTTLTEEKTRMETSFQADKKKLKREKEELEVKLKKKCEDAEKSERHLSERNAELISKLRSHQMEREKEQNNHAIMLRELQTLVALERSAKEELENQLDDLHRNLDKRDPIHDKCEEYRQQIRDLSNELQVVRGRMKAAEERASQTQPILVKLQEEMVDVKAQNQDAILREQCRANEAEDRLQQTARLSEDRVASLELKLSELSEIVGSNERVRQQDQQAIQRLKERVAQLDIENTALVLAAGHARSEEKSDDNDEDLNLDAQSLVQKIIKLKGLLKVANQKSQNAINIEDFLRREGFMMEPDHEACKEELFRLKEEFERYKQRAHSVLKNRNTRDGDSYKEVETLKSVVTDLKNKVRKLTEEMEEREADHLQRIQGMEAAIVSDKLQNSQKQAKRETEFKTTVAELESEMQKQRTRTIALVEEKDAEMKLLKMSLGILKPSSRERKDKDDDENVFSREGTDSATESLSSELSRLLSMGHRDGHLLHYAQEIAKKEAEVSNLRRNKHQLEGALRELQATVVARDERHYDEIENLQLEIGRLKRNCSREGANLEYLKNVVLSYMLSSDANSRRHMLNAIATLLKFSPKELHNVTQHNASRWWQQPSTPTSSSSASRSDGH